ncbi:MAG TPA: transglutaminase-like domain-containing protein [Pirellulales bacterium]
MALNRRRLFQLGAAAMAGGTGWNFALPVFAAAQTPASASDLGAKVGEKVKSRFKLGISITAKRGQCIQMEGTAPMPIEWPEQDVKIEEEDVTPGVRSAFREVSPTVRQLVLSVPFLAVGQEAHALLTVAISRAPITPPTVTDVFQLPDTKKLKVDMKQYLRASPGIETAKSKFRDISKEVTEGKGTAWEQVEALYDWTRENIEYVNGPFKGAWRALNDKNGDCEELSSVFIALCRCHGVPARTVWVPDHCYAEFYLEDDAGRGYWFPCQAAGARDFGGIPELRPILQKGDNFIVPEERKPVRYVAEKLTGKGGSPGVKFIRESLDAD